MKAFFANKQNNQAYVDALTDNLIRKGVECKKAKGDADLPMGNDMLAVEESNETYSWSTLKLW